METLEVDFNVWKALTERRTSKDTTYNDVLRELLGLETVNTQPTTGAGTGWTWKGVNLPNGTKLRAEYKGKEYTAHISQDLWIQNGEAMTSPSKAASSITQTGVNGWAFWHAKKPDSADWVSLASLRS